MDEHKDLKFYSPKIVPPYNSLQVAFYDYIVSNPMYHKAFSLFIALSSADYLCTPGVEVRASEQAHFALTHVNGLATRRPKLTIWGLVSAEHLQVLYAKGLCKVQKVTFSKAYCKKCVMDNL